jgi:uncharacterized repeat protein (TIGR02543 family)
MNMAKAFGTAILALVIVLVSCNPSVSNLQMRRGYRADGTVGSGGPPVTNQTLAAPTGVNTAVLSTGRIRVSWNAVPGATSYRVYYGDPNDNAMKYYVIVTAPSTSWEDNDALDNGNTYYYQVQAINAAGEGPVSTVTQRAYTSNPTYTVTFSANGGSGTVPSQAVNAGSSITLPGGNGLSKSGYTFEGWNTNSSGTGATYSAGSSYTPTDDITLYAKWNFENPFLGTWRNVSYSDHVLTFTDHSVSLSYSGGSESGSYSYSGNHATLSMIVSGGTPVTWYAGITGSNSLQLSYDDSGYYYDDYIRQ